MSKRFLAQVKYDAREEWAEGAGLWQDPLKYAPAFQNYIQNASGYDPETHIEQGRDKVGHRTAGAFHAAGASRLLTHLFPGHHVGLTGWNAAVFRGSAISFLLVSGERKGYLGEALGAETPTDILKPEIKLIESVRSHG